MLKKLIIFMILISVFMPNTNAGFLSSNSLDLYKSIDTGIDSLKNKELDYELKGGNKIGDISKNINNKLKNDGLKPCLKQSITVNDLEEIAGNNWNKNNSNIQAEAYGNINKLAESFKPECIKDILTTNEINTYISKIRIYLTNAKKRADIKTKNIYKISKSGIYLDGNTDNSQFDLIKDLQDINKIIFGEKLEYNGVEDSQNNFLDQFEKNPGLKELNNNTKNNNHNLNNNNNGNNDNNNSHTSNNGNNNIINDKNNNNLYNIPDGNNYVCPQNNNQSGLNPNDLNNIENNIENNNKNSPNYNFKTTKSGHLKLPDTNKINIPDTNTKNDFNFSNSIPTLNGNYQGVNDNSAWKCSPDSFFCITVDFITHKQKLLGYGSNKSIQGLIEVSNGHLKKGANTSLLQAKMGTNNFENILRDLDFSKMFHMGMIITKKTPPLLNIENLKKKDLSQSFTKKTLTKIYKNQGLNYKRKNDLTNLLHLEQKQREIINSAGLASTNISSKEKLRKKELNQLQDQNNYFIKNNNEIINKSELSDFYKQIIQYHKYISGLEEYANNISKYIKVMYKIPRGD